MNLEGVRVLLVEDNPADARFLREEIADVGVGSIRLVPATTLKEALHRLENEDYDVVLLDLTLPDENGLQTLVRAHAAAPKTPIVVLTGLDDEALAIRAVREGAQDYLVKGQTGGHLLVRAMRYATERKHAIEALQRREEHFRSLIENALDLITIITEDGVIRYASPSHERVLGYSVKDLEGRNLLSLIHPDDVTEFAAAFRGDEGLRSIESRVLHSAGSWRVLESFGRNLSHVAGVQGIVINSRDVTERKRAEDALREANNTLRAVIRTSPLAIYSVDLEGRVKSWNSAANRLFGWQEWELLGEKLPHLPESEIERYESHLEQVRRGITDAPFDTRCRTRDGRMLEVNIWSGLLRDGGGSMRGIVHVAADVTERKRLEEQLHHSQKLEAVGRLAGGVAHDFNNLLMIIQGYSQMLLSGMSDTDPVRADVEEIVKGAERASDLTKQLLAFSRRQIIQPKILDLNALVRDMERMLKRVIGEDIKLACILDPGLKTVRADPGQMEQVILNLVVNSRDAMPAGGRLTIETANVYVSADQARKQLSPTAGDYVMLAVSDTGVGIDSDTQSHIFEPFFTTKERGKGTGLGLSTSYGIIKQGGGDIWVDSEPGQGTTLKIFLPVAEQSAEVRTAARGNTILGGHETVLLVEDDSGVRSVLETMLHRHGYNVLSCGSPQDALRICENHRDIHLLITDMVMPLMSGRELADKITAMRPGMRVLYVSGYTDLSASEQEALDPQLQYLQKPFTPDVLASKIREVLAERPGAVTAR